MAKKPTYEELEQRIKKLEKETISKADQIQVSGINIEWNVKQGTCTFENLPVAMMWIDTTLAGLMSGVQAMVGTERFGLALQSEGRKSVEEDWGVISQFSDFRNGFKAIANIAAVAGWGEWELVSLDENKHHCTFRVKNGWEGRYQKALGVNWGSGMLAGKMAGYSSKLFKTNCWAKQTRFITKGDEFDEFIVKPSTRSVENEIENLLLTDEATRADMAVALEKLQKEVLERMQVEEALRESEENLAKAQEIAHVGSWEWDLISNEVKWSDELFRILGFELDEVKPSFDLWSAMIHPSDVEKSKEFAENAMQGEEDVSTEYRIVGKDKSIRHIFVKGRSQFDNENNPVRMHGIVRDITQHKQAEEELQTLASIVKYSSELVNLATLDGKMIFLNKAGSKMLGIDSDKVEQVNIMEVIPDDLQELVQTELIPTLMGGDTWEGELKYRNIKTGEIRDVHAMTFTIKEPNTKKPLFLANVSLDITERKRAEEEKAKLEAQLQQAQKMESIGTLAGGIAHDFNNILSPIILYTEMVLEDISEKDSLRFNLEEVLRASLRAKDLVKQILTFSHQAEQEKIPLIINFTIKEVLKLLRASLPSTIEIRQNIKVEDVVVLADPTQIHQILMNLCTNAAHSMRERGGVLEVGLVDVDLHPDDTDHTVDLEPGQYIKLTVSDTGRGIDSAIMNKIFDPYFTTQEKGKGTGLGLSVVHGIVSTHGGHISVYSEPDKGARFDVYLPLFDLSDIKTKTASPGTLATGDGHILIVDDEKIIVDVIQQMLERLGYKVTARTSSIEALEAFRASMDKFDLVITDLTMPNMTGDKLSVELMNIRPDIPIILCTGFSERMSKKRAEALGIKILMKPIVKSDLAKLIREMIDKS